MGSVDSARRGGVSWKSFALEEVQDVKNERNATGENERNGSRNLKAVPPKVDSCPKS